MTWTTFLLMLAYVVMARGVYALIRSMAMLLLKATFLSNFPKRNSMLVYSLMALCWPLLLFFFAVFWSKDGFEQGFLRLSNKVRTDV